MNMRRILNHAHYEIRIKSHIHFNSSRARPLHLIPLCCNISNNNNHPLIELLAGNHSLGNHLATLLRDAEQKVRELAPPLVDTMQQQQLPGAGTQFNSRASFTNITGKRVDGPCPGWSSNRRVYDYSDCVTANGPLVATTTTTTAAAPSAGQAIELDKQLNLWERRVKGLRRMLLGWDQTKPPEAPVSVFVDVIDATTVSVKVHETTEGPLGTKFRGEREFIDGRPTLPFL